MYLCKTSPDRKDRKIAAIARDRNTKPYAISNVTDTLVMSPPTSSQT